jgi:hypothetical protein
MHLYVYVSPEVLSRMFWIFMIVATKKSEYFQMFKTLMCRVQILL